MSGEAASWENGSAQSTGGELRDELLNGGPFLRLSEARYVLDEWREEHDHRRPACFAWYNSAATPWHLSTTRQGT